MDTANENIDIMTTYLWVNKKKITVVLSRGPQIFYFTNWIGSLL